MRKVERKLEELLLRAAACLNQNKTSSFIELWDPEGGLMLPGTPVICGKQQIEEWSSVHMRSYSYDLCIEIQAIHVEAFFACADGRFIVRVISTETGEVRVHNGKFLSVLRPAESIADTSGDNWRIFRWCCNSSLPPSSE